MPTRTCPKVTPRACPPLSARPLPACLAAPCLRPLYVRHVPGAHPGAAQPGGGGVAAATVARAPARGARAGTAAPWLCSIQVGSEHTASLSPDAPACRAGTLNVLIGRPRRRLWNAGVVTCGTAHAVLYAQRAWLAAPAATCRLMQEAPVPQRWQLLHSGTDGPPVRTGRQCSPCAVSPLSTLPRNRLHACPH